MLMSIPKEKVLIQEIICENVGQWKDGVDGQEQGAVDGNQLQTLQARHPAGQGLWTRLPQPVIVRLEAKERTFREMEG